MVLHVCKRCKKKFARKDNYTRHLNRKIPCSVKENNNITIKDQDAVKILMNIILKNNDDTQLENDLNNDKLINEMSNFVDIDKKNSEVSLVSQEVSLTSNEVSQEVSQKVSQKVSQVSQNSGDSCEESPQQSLQKVMHVVQKKRIRKKKLFICPICDSKFKHKNNYYRHKKHYCRDIKENNKEKKELEKEIENLKEQVDKLKMSQHITNNIVIAYNKQPDLSHLTDKDYLRIMNKGFKSVPKLIEEIHFNPNKPENKNIYIPSIKNKYAMGWNGNKWDVMNRNEVIDDMYDDKSNILMEKLEELESSNIDSNKLRKFKRFISKQNDDEIKNKIKEEIKLLLYNNKNNINK